MRLVLDTETMLERLRRLKDRDSHSQRIAAKLPRECVLELRYKDYFSSSRRKADADLFRFLDVEPVSAASRQTKIGSDRLDEIVHNYPKLCRALSGAECEGMLD